MVVVSTKAPNMLQFLHVLYIVAVLLPCVASRASAQEACLSPYQMCEDGSSCVIDPSLCGICSEGEYLCPFVSSGQTQTVCVSGASAVAQCPVRGTHFDTSLSTEQRVKYLVSQTTVAEQVSQLTNESPALPHLGVPFYNCE